jgi:guanylate kinase
MSNEGSPQTKADAHGDDWLLLILSSPSGAGKTTLKTRLLGEFRDLRFSISHTTRKRRPSEVDGREYHFVDRAEFEDMVRRDAFAEWAEVHGNLYGTCLAEIEAARATHRGVVFDIDYQGARQLLAKLPNAVTVFILPPSMEELERRLRGRADEAEESIARRLRNARIEVEHYALFRYVIVNDDIERAVGQLRSIVLAERCRRQRLAPIAERLLASNRTTGTLGLLLSLGLSNPRQSGAFSHGHLSRCVRRQRALRNRRRREARRGEDRYAVRRTE